MSPAVLTRPVEADHVAPAVERCPECTVPLVQLDEHGAKCAAGHVFRRVHDRLIPRDHRMETG